ncbi:MAG: ABC transporter substrate-binding protein [Thiolinea sp.]
MSGKNPVKQGGVSLSKKLSLLLLLNWGYGIAPGMAETTMRPPVPQAEVEITHWWVAQGELAALQEIRKAVEKQGQHFTATSFKSYDALRGRIIERINQGYPPAMTQWLAGKDMLSLLNTGTIRFVTPQWRDQKLENILYPEVMNKISMEGKVIAIPAGIHTANKAYFNASIYHQLDLEPPRDWEEFLQQAPRIKAAGFTPLTLYGGRWQLPLLFYTVLLDKMDVEGFRNFHNEQTSIAPMREKILSTLETTLKLKEFSDYDPDGRWFDSTQELLSGRAAMQIVGDYAKGEMTARQAIEGRDYLCSLSPGAKNAVLYSIDSFLLLKTDDPALQQGQDFLMDIMLTPELQIAFNTQKGSIPVRKDMDISQLDNCSQKTYQIWRKGGSHHRLPFPDSIGFLRRSFVSQILDSAWNEDWDAERATNELIRLVDGALAQQFQSGVE